MLSDRQEIHRATAVCGLAIFATLLVASVGRTADEVDDYVEAQRVESRIPGLALLVVRDGTVVKSRGYGLANVELQVPVTEQTIFQSGSLGKQFTATGVMMLVEEGRLDLDDAVRKFLPDAPEAWQAIKIRHLLSHTSGLGDYPRDFDLRRDYTTDQLLQAIYASPLAFEAGAGWKYSNLGYVTLGIVMEKATGGPYGELLAERIFKPLGMSSTRVISEADIVPHRAAGYRLVHGELKNQQWVSPTMNSTADGSLYTNLLDMAKWDAALTSGSLLKPESQLQMWTVAKLADGAKNTGNYGFGWVCEEVAGHRIVRHGGAWQGFVSGISRYLDDHMTIVVFANLSASSARSFPAIERNVAAFYVPALKTHDEGRK
ncbi:MAG TPA: serine hydrolase domain-containing protein [Pirellulales bacterium]|nr:serine hydrolase domain-containing protein [Pirellulales bacterium]